MAMTITTHHPAEGNQRQALSSSTDSTDTTSSSSVTSLKVGENEQSESTELVSATSTPLSPSPPSSTTTQKYISSPIQRFMEELQRTTSARTFNIVEDNPRLDLNLMCGRRSLLVKKLSTRSIPSNMILSGSDREEQLREKRDRRWAGTTDGIPGPPGIGGSLSPPRTRVTMLNGGRTMAMNSRPSNVSPMCPTRRVSTECIDIDEDEFVGVDNDDDVDDDDLALLDQRWGPPPPVMTRSVSDGVVGYHRAERSGSGSMSGGHNQVMDGTQDEADGSSPKSRAQERQRQHRRTTISRPSWGSSDALPDYNAALNAVRARYSNGGGARMSSSPSNFSSTNRSSASAPSKPIRRESVDPVMIAEEFASYLELHSNDGGRSHDHNGN